MKHGGKNSETYKKEKDLRVVTRILTVHMVNMLKKKA